MSTIWGVVFASSTTVFLIFSVCVYAERRLRRLDIISLNFIRPHGKLKLALSPYPDALLLDFIVKRSSKLQELVEVVPVSWSAVDMGLAQNKYDVAYGNKSVFANFIGPNGLGRGLNLLWSPNLLIYDGFAIMIHDDDWSLKKVKQSRRKIEDLLLALVDKKIAVSDDTDHLFVATRLFNEKGIHPPAIKRADTPGLALQAFFDREADAFVGGITERLIARLNGGTEYLSQDDLELEQSEVNCFGYFAEGDMHLKTYVMTLLAASFVESYEQIQKDKNYRSEFKSFLQVELPKLLTEPIRKYWDANSVISDENFDEMWSKWYKLPGTKSHSTLVELSVERAKRFS